MPCIFCIAVFALLAGTVGAGLLDTIEGRLGSIATKGAVRTADSESMARFELDVEVPGTRHDTPVVVTVYKKQGRIRIQLLSHDLTREQVHEIQRTIAALLETEIVDETDERDEDQVREVVGHSHDHDDNPSPENGWRTTAERSRGDMKRN